MNSIEEIIQEINESKTFARILEVGAGVPIANLMYSQTGASKSVYSSECYYSREAFTKKFGESKERAVSPIRLRDLIIENNDITNDLLSHEYNTIVATTFQVGEKNDISTHGWIGINFAEVIEDVNGDFIKDDIKYFHISIHESLTRKEYIEKIGEIGIRLLHSRNKFIPKDCYIDSVLDDMFVPIYEDCVNAIINSGSVEQMSVFHVDGQVDRIESITRGVDNLILYKGSFNPPTIAHQEIAIQSLEHYDKNAQFLFCISVNTVEKGAIYVNSLIRRIKNLHLLGFSVIICNRGKYIENIKYLRLKFKGNIIFPMGVDTINRLSTDYYVKTWKGDLSNKKDTKIVFSRELFEQDFFNSEIICFSRGDEKVDYLMDNKLVNHKQQKYSSVSSSEVRNLFERGEDEVALNMIPHPIRHFVIKEFSKR